MELFQILDCSSTLGTCCSSNGVAQIVGITRTIFGIIQIIVPILLIVMATIQFIQLVINPDEKNANKKIINKIIAAVIIFFIPLIADAVLGLLPDTYSVSACWKEAINSTEIGRTVDNKYIDSNSNGSLFRLNDPDEYESGNPTKKPTPGASGPNMGNAQVGTGGSSNSNGSGPGGSSKGLEVVSYAKQFVGKPYKLGGSWNGGTTYTPTDCCGFIVGVYKHFGANLPIPCKNMLKNNSNVFMISENELQPGDIIVYAPSGGFWHYGIYAGNGREIVHAKGTKYGVVLDSDYKRCSSHSILGYVRVKGFN